MAYDPCGTQRLDGDVILKRIAEYLEIDVEDLKDVLTRTSQVNAALRNPHLDCGCDLGLKCEVHTNGPVSD